MAAQPKASEGCGMRGLMQEWPLRVHTILDHAARFHGRREVVTRSLEGPILRSDYATVARRARQFASALAQLGVRPGERVATLAWNTQRHLEAWYGIMGAGAVCHTLNPRLFGEQLRYIAGHAGDRWIAADVVFAEIAADLARSCPDVRGIVWLCERAQVPDIGVESLCYEELLARGDPEFAWVEVDEGDAAGLCYTSGTTGNPKGVLYSHRSNVLHALACNTADAFALSARSTVLPVVPLYHANAWALVFSAPMVGAKLVLPGSRLDGASLFELLETERVSVTAAVPTVWLGLLAYLEAEGRRLSHLRRVVIGGSAVPRSMFEKFEREHGVEVVHAWGMTETSPLGTLAIPTAEVDALPAEQKLAQRLKQGRPPYTVDLELADDRGHLLPWDGSTPGHLGVRGPGVVREYFRGEGGALLDARGYFPTGDVATLDTHGFMQITDRSKDVIKSGGEWISSIEIENLTMGHPGIAEAAVIGVSHPRWDERPLLIAVRRPGSQTSARELLDFLAPKLARWWLPDEVVFVEELPHTATGKVQKRALRERFAGHRPPSDGTGSA
jgi:fatty-acyl-CoA synthase